MIRKKTVTAEAARLRLADLCARSEQSEYDLRQKLFRMGIPAAESDSIIDFLIEGRFLDNARFARSFARDKCRFSAWGRNKIKMALYAKRISADDIRQGLEAIEPGDYEEALRRVATAKARTLSLTGEERRENRMKLYRHILSRGFEAQLAADMVNRLIQEEREGE